LAAGAVLGIATLAVGQGTAAAAAPERFEIRDVQSGTDPADTTCAFPVDYSQVEYGFVDVFTDQNDAFVKAIAHLSLDVTINANGHTLVERDTFTRTFYADGPMKDVGLTVHIKGPGGVVMLDAGQIVYSDTDETVSYMHGAHPQLLGASFCAELGR
jgi:hypothetical protein